MCIRYFFVMSDIRSCESPFHCIKRCTNMWVIIPMREPVFHHMNCYLIVWTTSTSCETLFRMQVVIMCEPRLHNENLCSIMWTVILCIYLFHCVNCDFTDWSAVTAMPARVYVFRHVTRHSFVWSDRTSCELRPLCSLLSHCMKFNYVVSTAVPPL